MSAHKGREFTLRASGRHPKRVQSWQRLVLRALFPIPKKFVATILKVDEPGHRTSQTEIDKSFGAVDKLLADGRKYVLNAPEKTYLGIYLACMLHPPCARPSTPVGALNSRAGSGAKSSIQDRGRGWRIGGGGPLDSLFCACLPRSEASRSVERGAYLSIKLCSRRCFIDAA
jgi:hypothetical protein